MCRLLLCLRRRYSPYDHVTLPFLLARDGSFPTGNRRPGEERRPCPCQRATRRVGTPPVVVKESQDLVLYSVALVLFRSPGRVVSVNIYESRFRRDTPDGEPRSPLRAKNFGFFRPSQTCQTSGTDAPREQIFGVPRQKPELQ